MLWKRTLCYGVRIDDPAARLPLLWKPRTKCAFDEPTPLALCKYGESLPMPWLTNGGFTWTAESKFSTCRDGYAAFPLDRKPCVFEDPAAMERACTDIWLLAMER